MFLVQCNYFWSVMIDLNSNFKKKKLLGEREETNNLRVVTKSCHYKIDVIITIFIMYNSFVVSYMKILIH